MDLTEFSLLQLFYAFLIVSGSLITLLLLAALFLYFVEVMISAIFKVWKRKNRIKIFTKMGVDYICMIVLFTGVLFFTIGGLKLYGTSPAATNSILTAFILIYISVVTYIIQQTFKSDKPHFKGEIKKGEVYRIQGFLGKVTKIGREKFVLESFKENVDEIMGEVELQDQALLPLESKETQIVPFSWTENNPIVKVT
jgi:preprotein translocase subunit YajC